MCIIIVKEKGVKLPDEKILKSCFVKNPDGSGFMYNDGKNVVINKGFMTFTSLKNALDQIENSTSKTIIIHMRIATSGNVDGKTCHPFPVNGTAKNIDSLRCKTSIGFAHNGILREFEYGENYSDTQNYVKDYLSVLYRAYGRNMLDIENVQHAINITSESCRFAFLEPSGTVTYFGKWYNENGVHYSNTGYQQTSYIKSYTSFNDKYDYDYESYYNSWFDDYDTIDSIIDKAFEDSFLTFDEMLFLQEHGTEISDSIYELEGIFIKTSKGLKVSVYDY